MKKSLEKLVITTIVDGYVDMFAPSRANLKRVEPGQTSRPLLGGHGSSFLADCTYSGKRKTLLIDGGLLPIMLENNLSALGRQAGEIDAIVLTHGHPDHYQGLLGMATLVREGCPFYVHPEAFRPRIIKTPRGEAGPWELKRDELKKNGMDITEICDWRTVIPGVYVTGELPETSVPQAEIPGNFVVRGGNHEPDRAIDEMAVVFDLGDKGLVVLTSCAHRPAPELARYVAARQNQKVTGLIAGLHLSRATVQKIHFTAQSLEALNLDFVIAGHCTGFNAGSIFQQALGESFYINTVGARLEL